MVIYGYGFEYNLKNGNYVFYYLMLYNKNYIEVILHLKDRLQMNTFYVGNRYKNELEVAYKYNVYIFKCGIHKPTL